METTTEPEVEASVSEIYPRPEEPLATEKEEAATEKPSATEKEEVASVTEKQETFAENLSATEKEQAATEKTSVTENEEAATEKTSALDKEEAATEKQSASENEEAATDKTSASDKEEAGTEKTSVSDKEEAATEKPLHINEIPNRFGEEHVPVTDKVATDEEKEEEVEGTSISPVSSSEHVQEEESPEFQATVAPEFNVSEAPAEEEPKPISQVTVVPESGITENVEQEKPEKSSVTVLDHVESSTASPEISANSEDTHEESTESTVPEMNTEKSESEPAQGSTQAENSESVEPEVTESNPLEVTTKEIVELQTEKELTSPEQGGEETSHVTEMPSIHEEAQSTALPEDEKEQVLEQQTQTPEVPYIEQPSEDSQEETEHAPSEDATDSEVALPVSTERPAEKVTENVEHTVRDNGVTILSSTESNLPEMITESSPESPQTIASDSLVTKPEESGESQETEEMPEKQGEENLASEKPTENQTIASEAGSSTLNPDRIVFPHEPTEETHSTELNKDSEPKETTNKVEEEKEHEFEPTTEVNGGETAVVTGDIESDKETLGNKGEQEVQNTEAPESSESGEPSQTTESEAAVTDKSTEGPQTVQQQEIQPEAPEAQTENIEEAEPSTIRSEFMESEPTTSLPVKEEETPMVTEINMSQPENQLTEKIPESGETIEQQTEKISSEEVTIPSISVTTEKAHETIHNDETEPDFVQKPHEEDSSPGMPEEESTGFTVSASPDVEVTEEAVKEEMLEVSTEHRVEEVPMTESTTNENIPEGHSKVPLEQSTVLPEIAVTSVPKAEEDEIYTESPKEETQPETMPASENTVNEVESSTTKLVVSEATESELKTSTEVPAEPSRESDNTQSSTEAVKEMEQKLPEPNDVEEVPVKQESEMALSTTEKPIFGVVPGEGNCLVDNQTYANNSVIPPASKCQTSCRCVSSIVHCVLVNCSPPPPGMKKCAPHYKENDCCPSYFCGEQR